MRIKINMYITYNTFLLTIFSSSRAEYCTLLVEYIESVHRIKTKEKGFGERINKLHNYYIR